MACKVPSIEFNNGHKIPILGLGTWNSPTGQVEQAVKDAIDCGYRAIDCAHVYQNEKEVGNGIASKLAEGVVKREDLFITSKLWNAFHRPDAVLPAIQRTLENLGLKYLDLYLIHWPMAYKGDEENLFPKDANGEFIDEGVDYLDTYRAMEKLVDLGLTKSIGVSNFNARQIDRIVENARILPVTNQVECHPYLDQTELKQHCESKKIVLTAYSPLGSPARPWAVKGEPHLTDEPVIVEIAKKYQKTSAQILIRYQTLRGIIAIPKSVTKERIAGNIQVFDIQLTDEEMNKIKSLNRNSRLCAELDAINCQHYPF